MNIFSPANGQVAKMKKAFADLAIDKFIHMFRSYTPEVYDSAITIRNADKTLDSTAILLLRKLNACWIILNYHEIVG